MKRSLNLALVLLLPLLAACSGNEVTSTTNTLNYSKMAPVRLNAVKIEVVSEYTPRDSAPNIDHLMEKNPQQAVVDWAKGRLRASGSTGYVQVKIKDASVITRMLEVEGGISGYFTREQSEELVAHVSADISGDQRDSGFSGYTTVEASQVLTVPEKASKAERAAVERDLLKSK